MKYKLIAILVILIFSFSIISQAQPITSNAIKEYKHAKEELNKAQNQEQKVEKSKEVLIKKIEGIQEITNRVNLDNQELVSLRQNRERLNDNLSIEEIKEINDDLTDSWREIKPIVQDKLVEDLLIKLEKEINRAKEVLEELKKKEVAISNIEYKETNLDALEKKIQSAQEVYDKVKDLIKTESFSKLTKKEQNEIISLLKKTIHDLEISFKIEEFVDDIDEKPNITEYNGEGEAVVLGYYGTWCGKVNQHKSADGQWETDADGVSGCNMFGTEYCQKYWPESKSYEYSHNELIPEWKVRGNLGEGIPLSVATWACLESGSFSNGILNYEDYCNLDNAKCRDYRENVYPRIKNRYQNIIGFKNRFPTEPSSNLTSDIIHTITRKVNCEKSMGREDIFIDKILREEGPADKWTTNTGGGFDRLCGYLDHLTTDPIIIDNEKSGEETLAVYIDDEKMDSINYESLKEIIDKKLGEKGYNLSIDEQSSATSLELTGEMLEGECHWNHLSPLLNWESNGNDFYYFKIYYDYEEESVKSKQSNFKSIIGTVKGTVLSIDARGIGGCNTNKEINAYFLIEGHKLNGEIIDSGVLNLVYNEENESEEEESDEDEEEQEDDSTNDESNETEVE
ncbi:hypothetical protein K8R47_00520 [archaeon]|nr:hypothetical protein [archaeon]